MKKLESKILKDRPKGVNVHFEEVKSSEPVKEVTTITHTPVKYDKVTKTWIPDNSKKSTKEKVVVKYK